MIKKVHREGGKGNRKLIYSISESVNLFLCRYDLKYASYDALNTKKKYQHVQSKVKVYIENMRKEDQERRKIRIAHHRSEPSELADWHKPDDIGVKLNESSIDWKLVLEKKNIEFNEMKSKLNEMKTYGDTMNELLNAERLRVS